MANNRTLFSIEALVLGGPSLAFMVVLLPSLAGVTLYMLVHYATGRSDTPLYTILLAPGLFIIGALAMWVAARLVIATIKGQRFNFGTQCWLACAAGAYIGFYVYQVFSPRTALFTVLPLFILVAHAAVIQIRGRHEQSL